MCMRHSAPRCCGRGTGVPASACVTPRYNTELRLLAKGYILPPVSVDTLLTTHPQQQQWDRSTHPAHPPRLRTTTSRGPTCRTTVSELDATNANYQPAGATTSAPSRSPTRSRSRATTPKTRPMVCTLRVSPAAPSQPPGRRTSAAGCTACAPLSCTRPTSRTRATRA